MHGLRNLASEMDYRDGDQFPRYNIYGTAEILNSYKEKISIGQPLDEISELGSLHRQLLQETDFYSINKTVLKKITVEEERDSFFDARDLPNEVKNILESLDFAQTNSSNLRQTISLVLRNGDDETLKWVAQNYEEFLDDESEDFIDRTVEYIEGRNAVVEKAKMAPQRDSYRRVEVFQKNQFAEAKERRLFHFKERLKEIQDLHSIADIEPFLQKIKPTYDEDMVLIKEWSQDEKANYRSLYLQFLRNRNIDEESIRRRVYFRFDRKPERFVKSRVQTRPVAPEWYLHFNEKGELDEKGLLKNQPLRDLEKRLQKKGKTPYKVDAEIKTTRSSYWDYTKSCNFCRIHQNRKQWNILYEKIWQKLNQNVAVAMRNSQSKEVDIWIADKIRRFQYRIDLDPIIRRLLKMTALAETGEDRTRVRIYLSAIQRTIPNDVYMFIVKGLSGREKRRKLACVHLLESKTQK